MYEKYLSGYKRSRFSTITLLARLTQILNQWKVAHPNEYLIDQVWLDGFVDLSLQEIDFLGALADVSRAATIVICHEIEGTDRCKGEVRAARSFWNHTLPLYKKILNYFSDKTRYNLEVESLSRDTKPHRFSEAPSLACLEEHWLTREEVGCCKISENIENEIEICRCPEIWDEAVFAAQKIIAYLQKGDTPRRFRDCFVVFRNINAYQGAFQRVFRRYKIPFFIDIPQSILHHRAAELTLQAFKTVVFGWRTFNLLSVLKTELAGVSLRAVDMLEEELLKHNYSGIEIWKHEIWQQWLCNDKAGGDEARRKTFNNIHKKSVAPLLKFDNVLKANEKISGDVLCNAIEEVWNSYGLKNSLEEWSQKNWDIHAELGSGSSPNIHLTVWEELKSWLENVKLAFGSEQYNLAEWAKILEAGIKSVFVAAIPPSLDQVVLGNIDRSRTTSVKLVIVPGANETVFPAYEEEKSLFTDNELETLQNFVEAPVALRLNSFQKTDKENYLSYISFTRSSQKLIVSYAAQNDDGSTLKPSRYISELKKIFPQLQEQKFSIENLKDIDILNQSKDQAQNWTDTNQQPITDAVSNFYGPECSFSVSNLESYANCPFQFFVKGIAKCKEREEWGMEADKLGTFMHLALRLFHEKVIKSGEEKSWRSQLEDVPGTRELVHECVDEAAHEIFNQKDDSSFTDFGGASEMLNVEKKINFFLNAMRGYFEKYRFDPTFTELGFGKNHPLCWKMEVNKKDIYISGRVDRVDIYKDASNNIWVVVIDYKSSGKNFKNENFDAGIQLQLIAYLCALRYGDIIKLIEKDSHSEVNKSIEIGGAFYVPLKTPFQTNGKALTPFQHQGCLDKALLNGESAYLDNRDPKAKASQQFKTSGKDLVDRDELWLLTDQTKEILELLIEMILKGEYSAKPVSCDFCMAKSVCRFDPRRSKTKNPTPLLVKSQKDEAEPQKEKFKFKLFDYNGL